MASRKGHTKVGQPPSASANTAPGDGYKKPIPILRELHSRPISLLAVFADCGTVLSGSRAVGGAHIEESDFDLYQPDDRNALIELVSTLNFEKVKWRNRTLEQIEKDIGKFGLAMIPLKEFRRLADMLRGNHDMRGVEKYLRSVMKEEESYQEFKDLPDKFHLALEKCMENGGENMVWVYKPGEDSGKCIRELPSEVTKILAKFFTSLRNYSPTTEGDDELIIPSSDIKKAKDLSEGEGDDKPTIPSSDIKKVKILWKGEGYAQEMLRRWIRYNAVLSARWQSDEIDSIINAMLGIDQPTKRTTGTEKRSDCAKKPFEEPYDWFQMLRGELPNGRKVQIMIVPEKRKDCVRQCGILGTILEFHATHPMGYLTGTGGGHFFHDSASKKESFRINFTDNPKQEHAEEGISKMKDRGWIFKDMHRGEKSRHNEDEISKWISYESIYKSALEDIPKGIERFERRWGMYFERRHKAMKTYEWKEVNA
ncbi:hypothetical protein ACJBU6_11529 [Exserohilum turcicum]